ncbi:MAG: DUF5777 family beta-barrel protein [Bacteroidales bacterium]
MKQFIFIFILISYYFLNAQEQDTTIKKTKEYVEKTFRTTTLFHNQTTEMTPSRSFTLLINHKFGTADFSKPKDLINDFVGLDLTSNIRFAFEIPLCERFFITVGRTRYEKYYDISGKALLLKQTTDNSMPISLALYSETIITTKKLENPGKDFFFENGKEFEYKFLHRFTYFNQVIISRKFNKTFSAQVAPCVIYRNLAPVNEDNITYSIPMGVRIRTSLMNNIVIEYAHVFNRPKIEIMPSALMYEIVTSSHVFQVGFCTTDKILPPTIYNANQVSFLKNKIILGFNLHKTFYLQKK